MTNQLSISELKLQRQTRSPLTIHNAAFTRVLACAFARAEAHISDETGNATAEFVAGNVSSIRGIDALARALLERIERLDVLMNVNNATCCASHQRGLAVNAL